MMNNEREVTVIGGGIIGLTSAVAMAQHGFKVRLIDAFSFLNEINHSKPSSVRAYAINKASQHLLEELNIWQDIEKFDLAPYQKMHIWDAGSGHHIDFDSRTIHENNLGHIIEENVLKEALVKKINLTPTIEYFPGHRIVEIQSQQESLHLLTHTNEAFTTKLLMIADGPNSFCRGLLKIPLTTWSYHQEALVALIRTEKSHGQTAYQVFTAEGPLAFLPLSDPHYCSIVWSTTPARARQLQSFCATQFNQALAEAFEYRLGKVQLENTPLCFPLTMRHTQQYSGLNWLLLGDAAHTVHPLAGLGLNLGFADLKCWLSTLTRSNHQLTKKVFTSYQRERKHAIWQVIVLMEGLKMLFLNPLFPVIHLRGIGIKICNHLSLLKKQFITYASGISDR